MPEFFPFIPGSETSRAARHHAADTSPLLGRFRAKPGTRAVSGNRLGQLAQGARGSVHIGYGALIAAELEENDAVTGGDRDDFDDAARTRPGRLWARAMRSLQDLWIAPRQTAVKRAVDRWWMRWGLLTLLPAALAVAWCAIPFPQYPLSATDHDRETDPPGSPPNPEHRAPGHGKARVQVNFWFFLFVYYGFYNLTALIWITKVFNLYSLNWWPSSLGFPLTMLLIAVVSLAAPIPVYLVPELRFLAIHNTAWISWTFVIMAMPVAIAFCILMTHERHLSLRHSLSETQRIFTSSWWTGDGDGATVRGDRRPRAPAGTSSLDPEAASLLQVPKGRQLMQRQQQQQQQQRERWLPASFVRFVWFCLALAVSLLAYLIGEAYAEIYLRTLPHNSAETIVYVYSWVATVHLLDLLTGWILGGAQGERVGSYPLSWAFKLYFMLTYQTYVRALYARLRSPSQFVWLQALSSGTLIAVTPLTMTRAWHRGLAFLGLTTQSYPAYQKLRTRDVFIRGLAENASMLAFLGSVGALHLGPNRDVYPYFAFDSRLPGEQYTFNLTFWASGVTWACEVAAQVALRGIVRAAFGVDVGAEGRLDLAVWPELLPTSVAVMVHVLQNMLFSIIRLHFH